MKKAALGGEEDRLNGQQLHCGHHVLILQAVIQTQQGAVYAL
jgi:hypothetical protein